jgi:hypothetical protein
MIAGVLGFTNVTIGISSSIDVGIPDFKSSFNIYDFGFLFFIALLGVVAGLGIGLIIGGVLKDNKTKSPKKRSRGIYKQDYKPGFTERYQYPSDEIPRSIRDYYKKQK